MFVPFLPIPMILAMLDLATPPIIFTTLRVNFIYELCNFARQIRLPFPASANTILKSFDLKHLDI